LIRPQIFKWAGVAAFASYQVGVALEMVPFCEDNKQITGWVTPGIELIKATNDAVYADLAWAHFVYLEAGFEALRSTLSCLTQHRQMLAGFRLLHEADTMMSRAENNDRANALAWQGSLLLLEHEQRTTVQPRFAAISRRFGALASGLTVMDFGLDGSDRLTTSFAHYTLRGQQPGQFVGKAVPSLVDFEQRWRWIQEEVWPLWRRTEELDPALSRTMQALSSDAGALETVSRLRVATALSLVPKTRELPFFPRGRQRSVTRSAQNASDSAAPPFGDELGVRDPPFSGIGKSHAFFPVRLESKAARPRRLAPAQENEGDHGRTVADRQRAMDGATWTRKGAKALQSLRARLAPESH
jgi:hypothetical protein